MSSPHVDRRTVYGFAFLTVIVAIILLTILVYRGVFKSTVPLVIQADRAGLTLADGAPVKLRGIVIGEVSKVSENPNGPDQVRIDLAIDKGQFGHIPANVTAEIVPPTAFGAKYVQLDPAVTSAPAITAGSMITADRVTVEVDTAFVNLTKVLNAAQPAQVSAALSSVAEAVDQRGNLIGNLISQTNTYLRALNPLLSTVTTDINNGARVADVYAKAEKDITGLASSAGVTAQTIVDQEASLHAFELGLTSFDGDLTGLLNTSAAPLTVSLKLSEPTLRLVARYSSELPCTILGLSSANKLAEVLAGGGTFPGITTITRVVPTREPYIYPANVPQIGDTSAPNCYGLPYVTPAEASLPSPTFRTGANPYAGPQPDAAQNALTELLGLTSAGGNLLGGQ